MSGSRLHYRYMCCYGSARYNFENIKTHNQELLKGIARISYLLLQTPKRNTGLQATFQIMTFTAQETTQVLSE